MHIIVSGDCYFALKLTKKMAASEAATTFALVGHCAVKTAKSSRTGLYSVAGVVVQISGSDVVRFSAELPILSGHRAQQQGG